VPRNESRKRCCTSRNLAKRLTLFVAQRTGIAQRAGPQQILDFSPRDRA
jgi:hypothetical protein